MSLEHLVLVSSKIVLQQRTLTERDSPDGVVGERCLQVPLRHDALSHAGVLLLEQVLELDVEVVDGLETKSSQTH